MAVSADAITWLPIRLAEKLGYAAEEGIRISVADLAGLSKGMEAVLGGSAEVTAGGLNQAIQVAAQGRKVRCFLVLEVRPALALALSPTMQGRIRTIADLKGRRIGVSSLGSPTQQFLEFLLISHHVSSAEVSVVSIGTGASSLAAIERGAVDAGVLVASGLTSFELRNPKLQVFADARSEAGCRKLFGTPILPLSGLVAKAEWLQSNPGTVRHFVRAVRRGMQWVVNHKPDEVRAMIPSYSRMPDPESDLAAIRHLQTNMSRDGKIPDGTADAVLKFVATTNENVRKANIDLSDLYTNEFTGGN